MFLRLSNRLMESVPSAEDMAQQGAVVDQPAEEPKETESADAVSKWFEAMSHDMDEDIDGMEGEGGEEESPEVETEVSGEEVGGEAEELPTAAEVTAPETEPLQPQTPVQAVEQESAPVQEAPQAAPETAPAPQMTEEQRVELRNQAQSELQQRYRFSEEEAERLRDSPEEVLPQLAANLYLDVYEQVMGNLLQQLPAVVHRVSQVQSHQAKGEEAFFSRWKSLNTPEGRQKVVQMGQVYRQMNPNVSLEQFIEDVGLQASVALRLPIEGYPAAQPVAAVSQPAAAPRQPASPVSAPARAVTRPVNPFMQMAEDMLREEE